jgi:hypothetical protein
MKRDREFDETTVRNASQPNTDTLVMKRDFDTVLDSEISEKQKVEDEFRREISLMLEFELVNPKEEKGALGHLEEMLFGTSDADSKNIFERMKALVQLFGDYSGEPVERYLN